MYDRLTLRQFVTVCAVTAWAAAGTAATGGGWPTLDAPPGSFQCYTWTGRFSDLLPGPLGSVYAGTSGGILVFRQDGTFVRKFSRAGGLGSHTVNELLSCDGVLWAATAHGVSIREAGEWRNLTTEDGLSHNCTYAVAADQNGRIYAGTERGVAVFDGERFRAVNDTHEFCRRATYAIHVAGDGSVWFARQTALSRLRPDGRWETYQRDPLRPGPRAGLPSNNVLSIATDAGNRPWIGTKMGLCGWNGSEWRHVLYPERLGRDGYLLDNRVQSLVFDSSNTLWLAHGDARDFDRPLGVARLSKGRWRYLTADDGLPSDCVYRLRADRDGGVWVASLEGGCRLPGDDGSRYKPVSELADNHVRAFQADGTGGVTVVTWSGTRRFEAGRPDSAALVEMEPEAEGVVAVRRRARLLTELKAAGARHVGVRASAIDENGDTWVGTRRRGLLLQRGGRWFRVTLGGLSFPLEITALCYESPGILWVGTAAEGAIRIRTSAVRASGAQAGDREPAEAEGPAHGAYAE